MTQEIITQISETVGTEVFGIWFLIGAAFVFFMQAGFAMVETGFTRAKNAGNIIMKNLMDFCIRNGYVHLSWLMNTVGEVHSKISGCGLGIFHGLSKFLTRLIFY